MDRYISIFCDFLMGKYKNMYTIPPKNIKELYDFAGKFEYEEDTHSGFIKIIGDWEKENITIIELPIKYYDGKIIKILVHKKIKDNLLGIFNEYKIKEYDKKYPIKQIGCFVPRHKMSNPKRSLSIHSWGLALDINWNSNPVGRSGDMPVYVITLFKQYGWNWGGLWDRPKDPMHFQFYTGK